MSGNVMRIDPLNSSNYDTWKLQMRAILIKNDLWSYVDGSTLCPDGDTAANWRKMDQKACADLLLSITPSELGLIAECSTSREIWLKLEDTFQSKGPARKATLLKRVALARMKDGDNVRDHINDFFDAVSKLKEINVAIGDDLLAILLLYSLPDSFETFRCALETRDELPKPEVLRVKILEEDQSRRAKVERDDQNALYAKPKRNGVSSKFSNRSTENRTDRGKQKEGCFKCGKFGHYARNCRSKQNANLVQEGSQENSMFNCFDSLFNCLDISHEWCLDSGCTSHMSSNKEGFTTMKKIDKNLCLANGEMSKITAVGDVRIKVVGDRQEESFIVRDVMYVKDLRTNLLSISKLADKGYKVKFNKDHALILKENKVMCKAERRGNLYFLKQTSDVANSAVVKPNDMDTWHQRLGHLNESDLKLLAGKKGAHGINIRRGHQLSQCKVCLSEKQTRERFESGRENRTSEMLEVVHSDVCGPMKVNSHSNSRYFVTFIDDYSRYCEVYFLKKKSEVFDAFKKYKNSAELLTGTKIKHLQSDNGTEYINKDFNKYLEQAGIKRRLTAPHTPQQNGIAERKNRTLIEMARCMMKQAGVPESFWAEAINTACYLRNRCPTRSLNGQLPIKVWTGKTPSIKHLRPFGIRAYVLIKDKSNGKFDSRSEECILVGYSEVSKAYRFWSSRKKNIIVSRDVKFINEFYGKSLENYIEINLDPQAESDTPEDEQVEDVQKEINLRSQGNQNVLPQQQKSNRGRKRILRTGGRGRPRKLSKMSTEIVPNNEPEESVDDNEEADLLMDCEHSNVAFTDDPVTCDEAMNSEDGANWQIAIEDEYVAQILNGTWKITERPQGKNIIGNRFVLRTKANNKRKARLVAKGCSQRPGEDFSDTYSPVVRSSTIRMVAALAVEKDFEIHQMDFVTAYLNGNLDEDVYMEIPDYLEDVLQNLINGEIVGTCERKSKLAKEIATKWMKSLQKCRNPICKLEKALYGLRQSGLKWYQKLSQKLKEMGLEPSKLDPCLFLSRNKSIMVTVYVDDLLIATNDKKLLNQIKKSLAETFEMKDLGKVSKYVGIEFKQDMKQGKITINQKEYIESVLKRFDMQNCKPTTTPMELQIKLEKPSKPDPEVMQKYPYQSLIGALMYLAVNTRPDIAYPVNFLSQFNSNYNAEHWQAAKRILRYLKGTINQGLQYKKSNVPLYGVVDADWGSNLTDRRSYSGFSFIMSGAAITWEARKQRTVALSSTEAELLAITDAVKEALYLKRFFEEVGATKTPIHIFNDSQSAQKLIQSIGHHSRTKHIDVRYQFIQETIQGNEIKLEYRRSEDMAADVLTKGLGFTKHKQHIQELGVAEVA